VRLRLFVCLAAMVSAGFQEAAFTNSMGIEFVRMEPGTMTVGVFEPPYPKPPDPSAPPPARGRGGPALTPAEYERAAAMAKADSRPGFPVTIARPFMIGKYEVTQAQWQRVMGSNPSIFQGARVTDDAGRHPVDNVTWDDAQAFVKKLNALERTNVYRLPTEFEWEFAARAGGPADIPWPEIRAQAIAGYNAYTTTHMVGEKKPNAWGLYDVMGNVWEWVQDAYNGDLFADPKPSMSGRIHVLKGGGFAADVKNAIPATHAAGPGSGFDVGFRIVREIERPNGADVPDSGARRR
jgi:formylglycine-generating enzyme required for sulfatase activity